MPGAGSGQAWAPEGTWAGARHVARPARGWAPPALSAVIAGATAPHFAAPSLPPLSACSPSQLEALDLANQSAPASANSGCSTPGDSGASAAPRLGAGATQRLALGKTDVDGLLALRCLHTVVMNNMQPIVRIGEQSPHDFTWLQRVLKQGGVRLTSNELAYQLQSKVGTEGGGSVAGMATWALLRAAALPAGGHLPMPPTMPAPACAGGV